MVVWSPGCWIRGHSYSWRGCGHGCSGRELATEPILVATEPTLVATKATLGVTKATQADGFGFVHHTDLWCTLGSCN